MSRLIKVALKHSLEFQYQNCEQASIASGLQTEVFSGDQMNFAVIHIWCLLKSKFWSLFVFMCITNKARCFIAQK